jgi:hypothetical protein
MHLQELCNHACPAQLTLYAPPEPTPAELELRKVAALERIAELLASAQGVRLVGNAIAVDLRRSCSRGTCAVPGQHNGCACAAAQSGGAFSANNWCDCTCHLPVSTTSGGTPP